MANTLITQEQANKLARTGLSLLSQELVLGRLVWRDAESEFTGGVGTVVNVKKPGTASEIQRVGKKRTPETPTDGSGLQALGPDKEITHDGTVTQAVIPVEITNQFVHSVPLNSWEKTFVLENFAADILAPQAQKIGEALESEIGALLKLTADLEAEPTKDKAGAYAYDPKAKGALREKLIDAGTIMTRRNISSAGRLLVVSPEAYAALLKDDLFIRADQSGSTDALRNANVGNILNFTVYLSNEMGEGQAVAMTREAYAMAVRAAAKPEGVTTGSSQSYQGYGMRWMMGFDNTKLEDLSIADVFVGVKELDGLRSVGLHAKSASF